MPETTFDAERSTESLAAQAVVLFRRAAIAVLAGLGLIVTLAAAGVIALAAIAIAVIFAAGVGVMWLLARIAAPRRARRDVRILEAHKGPRGWTVETRGFSV
jgi:Flp pilus assembly protein TadB